MKALLILFLAALPLHANPDLFRERFADPATRPEAIALLTPGTRDHFFHTALAHQLAGREKEYAVTIKAWKAAAERKDPVSTDGMDTLESRRMLTLYDRDPKAALAEMSREMDLDFDDTRPDSAAEEKALPTSLDSDLITAEAFRKAAELQESETPYKLYSQEVLYAEMDGLEKFPEEKIRWFIRSFKLTQHPKYVALLAKGLSLKQPVSIGSLKLDPLSLAQMDELRKAVPAVLSDEGFNAAYLSKIKPATPKNLERDPAAHAAFLAKCRDYILTLPPANNDLKAHVLYHHLRLQQAQGNHPKPDFLAYLNLPRRNHALIRPAKESKHFINGTDRINDITQCPSVPNDAELIESYLSHFLALSDTPDKDLVPLIQEKRLAILHARARILAGADPERFAPILGADEFKTLREEVRIGFAPTVPPIFSAAENVSLPLDLKNTPSLLIRIYELHSKSGDSEAAVDLDGLVPHHTRSIEFPQPPAVLHRENIALPELAGAGSWIVEFVAGRISARALIRKGNITPHITRTAAGQEVRLFDESAQAVADFSVTLGSENFVAKDGVAIVPNAPNLPLTSGTITAGKLSDGIRLGSRTDSLALETAFLLDREQLLANQETTLHLRNQLTNHGQPLPLEKVKNATLTLKAKLLGGVTTERVIADPLALAETNEIPFLVPADLLSLTITLSGTVTPETSAEPLTLTQSETYDLNHALLTSRIGTVFFSPTEAGHRLELRGRNGESLPNRPVTLSLVHRQYSAPITARLRTDDAGRITLGKLEDIKTFTASSSSIAETTFFPPSRKVEIPETYIIPANQALRIPLVPDVRRSLIRLPDRMPMPFEMIGNSHLSVTLESGSYQLNQDEWNTEITVFPADSVRGKWLVTADEIVPITNPATPTIASAKAEGDTLAIRIADASPETRVTVIAKRYSVPGWVGGLAAFPFEPTPQSLITRAIRPSSYLTDRRLSDEMRYILDRRAAKVFPGSMLPRPGQLLHRWTPEDIDQDEQDARSDSEGGELPSMDGRGFDSIPSAMRKREGNAARNHPTTLDFRAFPAAVQFSLTPDAEGKISIPLAKMEGAQFVQIIAADTVAADTVFLPLPASETPLRDRRLARPLPAESHHIATRSAAALAPGAEVEIRNLLDADWRAFTTLEEAYQFLLGSTGSDDLRRFSFLPKWPTLDEKEKLALLSAHHSHELHLFLARKDTAFFDKHVKPFLAAKPEPKFIDDYLLARDLTGYLRPAAFARLNAAEKALLAQALPASRKAIVNELDLRWQLEAPSPDAETVLFSQTLKGSDLTDTDSLGLALRKPSAPIRPFGDVLGTGGTPGNQISGIVTSGNRSGDAAVNRNNIDAILNSPEPSNGNAYISEKLRRIVIPSINFEEGTSLEEAIDFIRLRAAELDTLELDPDKKGMSFVIQSPRSNAVEAGELDIASGSAALLGGADLGGLQLNNTLRVRNVPLATALEYICDMATPKLRFKVDDFAVTLVPQTDTGEDLFTRTFRVPPDFAAMLNGSNSEDDAEVDPFAPDTNRGAGLLKPRPPIMELLKQNGIVFPEGSSVTLGSNGQLLVTNTPSEMDKIEQLSSFMSSGETDHFSDSASWEVLARDGTPEAVLNRLSTENLATIELDHILWRLRDKDFFLKATAILRQRLHMDEDVFLYAILHNDPASLSDLLESEDSSQSLGSWFSSKLISITPAIHHGWETREFDPIVNARAHPFGENPFLMHNEAREHYQAFLDTLAWKPALSAADELTFTLFLFLQDRVGEALDRFAKIDPAALPDRLQYDYLHAVALFHQEKPAEAKAIALPYAAKLPPGIWKDRYETVISQADELSRPVAAVPAEEKDTAPTLEITHKSDDWGMIVLKHTNLKKAEIRLYHIDLEILFSKDPFLKGGIESTLPPIAPNLVVKVPFEKGSASTVHSLPDEFRKGNILIAAEAENVKRLKILDSQAIGIRTNPADRTVQIIDPATGKPLPKTYIKVYAETTSGYTAFHKDGYTDLRGKFDYLSHTATDPSTIRRLAILVSHPEKGTRTTVIER